MLKLSKRHIDTESDKNKQKTDTKVLNHVNCVQYEHLITFSK